MTKQTPVPATGRGIFISYRRDDSAGYAGRLFDNLDLRFGRERLFRDVDNLKPGVDFVTKIDDALKDCGVLLAVIGTEWVDAQDAQGRRRLDDPKDFLRQEICAALDREIAVIPVLVHRATMPDPESLPEPLRPLARHQAVELDDARWNSDLSRLVEVLEPLLGEAHPETVSIRGRPSRRRWSPAAVVGVPIVIGGAILASILVTGPSAPKIDLSANPVGLLGVELEWSTPPEPTDHFEIIRDGQVIEDDLESGIQSFVDESATPGFKHRYRVVALLADGRTESEVAVVFLPAPSLEDARFFGTYLVKATYMSKTGFGGTGKGWTEQWDVSGCSEAPCGAVRLKITGGDEPGKYFGLTPAMGDLVRSDLEYKGRFTGGFTWCGKRQHDAPNDVATIEIRITRGEPVDGVWLAAAFEGVEELVNPAGDGCDFYSYTAGLTGAIAP